ncbi:MAG: hypothetical protein EB162_05130 [Euryarchaeota archaeon]|nr:hypothetical protein [Euryarchaeota archaeon]
MGTTGFVYATINSTAPSQPNYYYQSGSSTSPVTVLLPPTTNQGAGTHRLELTGRAGSTLGCQIALGVLSDPTDASTFVPLDSFVIAYASTGIYNPIVLNVRPHNPANGALAIQSYSYWYSDDWSWVAIPQCETPLNVTNTGATSSTLDFAWTHSGGNAQSFNIEYGPTGYTQGTGSTMTSTGASAQLTGLAASTTYDVYVQADCGGSGTSGWSNVATATTACGSETAPWSDDFESYSTGTANRFGCWTQDQSSSNPRWYADNGGTPSGNTGPSVDNTTGSSSGIYMFFESSSPASLGDTNSLLSPMIDVTALTTPYLEFYYHMFGSSMGDLHVDVYDDINGWQRDVILLSGQQTASSTAPYDKAAATLTTGASSVQIRFRGVRGSDFYGDKAIDDVSISEAPSCFPPAGLTASNILSTGFDVSWTSTDTDFNVEYGPSGYGQGTGAAFAVTGATSVTINGQGTTTAIMPNTSYDVYVQTNCGSSTSSWVGPITVTTLCAPIAMPYTEGFDGTTWPPTCWDLDNGTFAPVQYGSDYMEASFWSFSSGSVAYAVSPVITLTADARASFAWSHLYSTTYPGDQLILRVKEAGTSNWDTLKNLIGPSFSAPGAGNTTPAAAFIPEVMNLDVSLTGKDVVFEFVFNSGWGPDCFVDDFVVEAVPTCLEPSNLTASAITDTSFDISWTSADTDFNVEYGPAGFGQGTGATFSVTGATSASVYGQGSTTVGLDPNTSYRRRI